MGSRKVVLYSLVSLDGVAQEPSDWLFDTDEEYLANLARVIARQDGVLLGRASHDEWAGFWPTATYQPFADFINGTPKHLFSSSPPALDWAGTTVVDEPAEAYVARLKETEGGDLGIHGSITLAQSLVRAGLVDELRLVLGPTVAGTGKRLFAGGDLQRFTLTEARGTPAGIVALAYDKA